MNSSTKHPTRTAAPAAAGTPSAVTDPAAAPRAARPTPPIVAGWPLLLGVLVMRTVLLFAAGGVAAALCGGWRAGLIWSNVSIVPIDAVCILVVRHLLHRNGSSIRSVLAFRMRDAGWSLLYFAILAVAFFALTFLGNLVAYQGAPPTSPMSQIPLWVRIQAIVIMPVTIALAEELVYRGFGLNAASTKLGSIGSILVVSFFFALQHAALTPMHLQAQIARFITTFGAGVVFALLYRWHGRLWPVVFAHWLLDLIGLGVPLLLLALR